MSSLRLPDPPPPAPPRGRWSRAVKLAGGFALLAAGIAMLVLPGPGIPAVIGGLFILGDDLAWARKARARLQMWAASARARVGV